MLFQKLSKARNPHMAQPRHNLEIFSQLRDQDSRQHSDSSLSEDDILHQLDHELFRGARHFQSHETQKHTMQPELEVSTILCVFPDQKFHRFRSSTPALPPTRKHLSSVERHHAQSLPPTRLLTTPSARQKVPQILAWIALAEWRTFIRIKAHLPQIK